MEHHSIGIIFFIISAYLSRPPLAREWTNIQDKELVINALKPCLKLLVKKENFI